MNPCSPSSCGNIRNISFPFRLKHDPILCGDPHYELSCEKNVTLLYLNSSKYRVKAINYHNFTINLIDISINNNSCSFPTRSLYAFNFSGGYPYGIVGHHYIFDESLQDFPGTAQLINFISCPYPLKNSSFLTETNDCAPNSSKGRHSFIKVGRMHASDVNFMCRIDLIALTSYKFDDSKKNASVSEIHESLLYGFELSWRGYPCSKCKQPLYCSLDEDHKAICFMDVILPLITITCTSVYLIILLILVICLGVSIPGKIIVGFTTFVCGVIYLTRWEWSKHSILPGVILEILVIFIGLIIAVRFIIGFPFLIGYAIYNYRRRHLSMFEVIEKFLRSDDKLKPIRYSYSDIKKMTRGFREKLGQGGFGTVYKGKLRSGYVVAVKLLENARENGQDFMNEISTIGRIHHVNVVRLVGYCAERSKRALVLEFMPNGSLDKCIYNREETNYLTWERKYEIAVGVARGIDYLHKGCDIQILHFDIKPHNILLDDKFVPKISDFGLAKFFSTEKNVVSLSAARGTIGYVAPELINRGFGEVSNKADVYSFGMLLIEMVGLKRDLRGDQNSSSQYFPCWIYKHIEQGKELAIEEVDEINDTNRKIAHKMTIVALWCIQMSPGDRPSMNKVLEMLEAPVEQLRIPNRPPQSVQAAANYEDQSYNTYSSDSISFVYNDDSRSMEITVVND